MFLQCHPSVDKNFMGNDPIVLSQGSGGGDTSGWLGVEIITCSVWAGLDEEPGDLKPQGSSGRQLCHSCRKRGGTWVP